MQHHFLHHRLMNAYMLLLFVVCFALEAGAQRTSEKHLTLIPGSTALVDIITESDSLIVVANPLPDITIHTDDGTHKVEVSSPSSLSGLRNFTLEYLKNKDQSKPNYRIYYLNYVASVVKANDDIVRWDGTTNLNIDLLANDTYTTPVTIHINQKSNSAIASEVNQQIVYNNTAFTGIDYLHYTITDSLGTSDQGIIKIEQSPEAINEDEERSFVVNYLGTKNLSHKTTDVVLQDPFNGQLTSDGQGHFVYKPAEYFIGLDTFKIKTVDNVVVTYHVTVIDAERDPGFVRNDVVYTAKNRPVTFDVLANDLADNFPITYYSPQLVHDTLGLFTYNATTSSKSFTYKVTTGANTETGKITINVGNYNPQQDLQYAFDIPTGKDFVIEYNVPINGYSFSITDQPKRGSASVSVDSTTALSCGTAYGKAFITYTPDLGYLQSDSLQVRYHVPGAAAITYKLKFNMHTSSNAECPCIDDCVWSGDLNGDGRVSAQDLLTLGRFLGHQGPQRDTITESIWTGQSGAPWGITAPNGKDIKYADANGDGRLTADDASAIIDNYGKINNLVPNENLGYKDFPFSLIAVPEEADSGDTVIIYFVLGSEERPANDVHGISFGIDVGAIDSNSLDVQFYNDSWLADHSPNLQLFKDVSNGQIRTAFTRTSGIGASGFGVIGQMSIIGEEADGFKTENDIVWRNIISDKVVFEDGEGHTFQLENDATRIKQNRSKNKVDIVDNTTTAIYPNPAGDHVLVMNALKMENITIYDLTGKTVWSENVDQLTNHHLNLSALASGIYILKIKTAAGFDTKRLVKN